LVHVPRPFSSEKKNIFFCKSEMNLRFKKLMGMDKKVLGDLQAAYQMQRAEAERARLKRNVVTKCKEHGKNYLPCARVDERVLDNSSKNACILGIRFVVGSLTKGCPCARGGMTQRNLYPKSWGRYTWLKYEGQGSSQKPWPYHYLYKNVGLADLCDATQARVWTWLCIATLGKVPGMGYLPREVTLMIVEWVINTDTCVWECLSGAIKGTPLYKRCTRPPYVEIPRVVDVPWTLVPRRGLVSNGRWLVSKGCGIKPTVVDIEHMTADIGMVQSSQFLGNLGRAPHDHYDDPAIHLNPEEPRQGIDVQGNLPSLVHNRGDVDIRPGDEGIWVADPQRPPPYAAMPIRAGEDVIVEAVMGPPRIPTEQEIEAVVQGRRLERKAQKARTRRQRKGKGKQRRPKHQKHQRPRRGTPRDRRGGNRY
jgi:hypothetical protein